MGSSAVTVTALALNTRTHAHMRTAPTHPTAVAHTHSPTGDGAVGTLRYGGVGGVGVRVGIAPTGGTLLDLWMRQKSHYGLLWLADRSLSAA